MSAHIPTRPLRRSPVGCVEDLDAALLGCVLEVEADGYIIRWPKGSAPLAWSPSKKALVVLEQATKGPKHSGDEVPAAVRRSYEDFNDRNATFERTYDIPTRSQAWVSCGHVQRVDYYSTKWGAKREYTHKTGPRVRLYRYGAKTKAPWLWVITGGRMTVTARGIVG